MVSQDGARQSEAFEEFDTDGRGARVKSDNSMDFGHDRGRKTIFRILVLVFLDNSL
jgi:hypothetical protein